MATQPHHQWLVDGMEGARREAQLGAKTATRRRGRLLGVPRSHRYLKQDGEMRLNERHTSAQDAAADMRSRQDCFLSSLSWIIHRGESRESGRRENLALNRGWMGSLEADTDRLKIKNRSILISAEAAD